MSTISTLINDTNSQILVTQSSLTSINDEIAAINSSGYTGMGCTGFQTLISSRLSRLTTTQSQLTSNLTELQTQLANITFTTDQQTVVDSINTLFNNKYESCLLNFQSATSDLKNNFFSLYAAANSDMLRECVIMEFFNFPC
jgi:hypothetical protein